MRDAEIISFCLVDVFLFRLLQLLFSAWTSNRRLCQKEDIKFGYIWLSMAWSTREACLIDPQICTQTGHDFRAGGINLALGTVGRPRDEPSSYATARSPDLPILRAAGKAPGNFTYQAVYPGRSIVLGGGRAEMIPRNCLQDCGAIPLAAIPSKLV